MDPAPTRKIADSPEAGRPPTAGRLRRWFGRHFTADPDDFADRRANIAFLILYAALVTLPLLFSTNPGGQSISLAGYRMPPGCFSREIFGVSCPGCGLGRSFVATAHGHFAEAMARHRLGIFLYALFASQALLRIWCLWRAPRRLPRPVILAHHWAALTMIVLLIGNWTAGLWLGGNGW